MKKYLVLLLLLAFVPGAFAYFTWNNSTGNQLWSDPLNWVEGSVPAAAGNELIDGNGVNGCILDINTPTLGYVKLGSTASTKGELTIDGSGAELLCKGGYIGALVGGTGSLAVQNGGTLTNTSTSVHLYVGHYDTGSLYMSGASSSINLPGRLYVGGDQSSYAGGPCEVIIDGGTLNVASYAMLGDYGKATLTVNGGTCNFNGGAVILGHTANAPGGEIDMTGGVINSNPSILWRVGGNSNAPGKIVMTGGVINDAKLYMPYKTTTGTAEIDLFGGTLNATAIVWRAAVSRLIHIKAGLLTVDGDVTSAIETAISNGDIISYDGRGVPTVQYNSGTGETDVYANPVDYNDAYALSPTGADAASDGSLTWMPGDNADTHYVYLGTDAAKVAARDASTAKGAQTSPYNPGTLDYGQTYYWCVDEYDSVTSTTWAGDVVSFTVADYLVLDDFSGYDNINPLTALPYDPWDRYPAPAGTVWATWVDGYDDTLSGSTTYDADGALRIDYDNDGSVTINGYTWTPGYYSEITRNLGGMDMTAGGKVMITFDIKGSIANAADAVYVTLSDASGSSKIALADTTLIKNSSWTRAYFKLSDFSIDTSNVTKIAIGVGDPASAGGTGTIYIDNIRLSIPTCVPSETTGDTNGDCVVNYDDIQELVDSWLSSGSSITSVDPGTSGLVLYYNFEGSAIADQVGSNDGTNAGGTFQAGASFDGSDCIYFSGAVSVDVPITAFSSIASSGEFTISLWLNGDDLPEQRQFAYCARTASNTGHVIALNVPWANIGAEGLESSIAFESGHTEPQDPNWASWYYGWELTKWDVPSTTVQQGWNNITVSKNTSTGLQKMYFNGELVAETINANLGVSAMGMFTLGNFIPGYSLGYRGKIDEFKVYDRELSAAEVLYLAQGASVSTTVPPMKNNPVIAEIDYGPFEQLEASHANVYDSDLIVNFQDFALMASEWLIEQVWP